MYQREVGVAAAAFSIICGNIFQLDCGGPQDGVVTG